MCPMKSNVVIVGMPRSGTSMVANIFVEAGYFVSSDEEKDLRAGDEFNPSGYWESQQVIDANDEIFTAVGFQPDNTWLSEAITGNQASKILELSPIQGHSEIVKKFNQNKPWIWKDPRLCYTIGYWWKFFENTNTKIIFLRRDEGEIYNSFLRLNWRDSSQASKDDVLLRIEEHIEFARHSLNSLKIPNIEVWYSDFKNKPNQVSKQLEQFTGININNESMGYNKKLNTSSLRGKIMKLVDRVGDLMPDKLRKLVKKLTPTFILKYVFPHRFTK